MPEPTIRRNANIIYPSQNADFERRKDGEPEPVLFYQADVVGFDACTAEHVVPGLFHQGSYEAQLAGVAPGGSYFVLVPFLRRPSRRLCLG